MSKKSAAAQHFNIQKSRLLILLLGLTHGLSLIASFANSLAWIYQFLIFSAVAINLVFYLRRYHFKFKPYSLTYENSIWSTNIQNGNFQPLKILPSSVITLWIIVLHFQLENGKFQSLVILNDALNDKDYRALTVMLKIAGLNKKTPA